MTYVFLLPTEAWDKNNVCDARQLRCLLYEVILAYLESEGD